VSIETVPGLPSAAYRTLRALEWTLTLLFTAEYLLRLAAVRRPVTYARSFFGVVDLLAIVPTYVSLVVPGAQALLVVRVLRLLRVFRVLKLTRYLTEAATLGLALRASVRKIAVFLLAVSHRGHRRRLGHVRRRGADARLHEHPDEHVLGGGHAHHGRLRRHLAADAARPGAGLARDDPRLRHHRVPTGIVTAELTRDARRGPAAGPADGASDASPRGDPRPDGDGAAPTCARCHATGHAGDARFCRGCGAPLRVAAGPRG
jgi:voltage-gated potassium channel